jgi:anthranilate phosphoribosyltransferase
MSYGHYIKELGRGAHGSRSLSREDAQQLYAAMLDGGVPDLELGAIIIALRVKGESLDEMLGFFSALKARVNYLELPEGRVRPVILPSYNGARKEANLTPLLALLLQRFGVPVVVHGLLEGFGRVTSGQVFRELGVMPSASSAQAETALNERGLVFLPLNVLCPGIYTLLNLRGRMGVRNSAHSLVKLINPFEGDAVMMAAATHPDFIELMRNIMLDCEQRGILLRGTEGEPFANPYQMRWMRRAPRNG